MNLGPARWRRRPPVRPAAPPHPRPRPRHRRGPASARSHEVRAARRHPRRDRRAGAGPLPADPRARLRRPRRRHAAVRARRPRRRTSCRWTEALAALPAHDVRVEGGGFDVADEEYAEIVAAGASRTRSGRARARTSSSGAPSRGEIPGFGRADALALFRRLLAGERGAYWTFVVHTGRADAGRREPRGARADVAAARS